MSKGTTAAISSATRWHVVLHHSDGAGIGAEAVKSSLTEGQQSGESDDDVQTQRED
jgi:hypothetical protein